MRKEYQEIVNNGIVYEFQFNGPITACCMTARVPITRSSWALISAVGETLCVWDDLPRYSKAEGKRRAFFNAIKILAGKVASL